MEEYSSNKPLSLLYNNLKNNLIKKKKIIIICFLLFKELQDAD